MSVSKLVSSNGLTAIVVGLVVWWVSGHQPSWLEGDGQVDVVAARVASVSASCELGASARELKRQQVLAGLDEVGHCSIDWCEGDPPAACPPGTVLADTGEPADVPVDDRIKEEVLKDELREEVKDELKAEAAAADEAAGEEAAKD